MGTSIHMHIEVKDPQGQWHHIQAPHIYRDYVFFDLLAGVWGKYKPVAPVRGLPEDASWLTQELYRQDSEDYKLHHATWLNSEELVTLQERLTDIATSEKVRYGGGDTRQSKRDLEDDYFHLYLRGNAVSRHQGWEDVRLIAWFDN